MTITSLDNIKVVEVSKLFDKKYRKQLGRYVIEGVRLVDDAIKYGAKIIDVFVKESVADSYFYENRIVVSDKVFAKMCDTVNNQGVLATVEKPPNITMRSQGNVLVLDCLQDPGNAGTLMRTAVACGFTGIYSVNSVDLYSPKVLRSAMSAHFCLDIYESNSIENVLEQLVGYDIIACDMNGENLFESEFQCKAALILGNEGNGLSDFSRRKASRVISLPMANNFESLNVAVAGSVIMYQIYSKKY